MREVYQSNVTRDIALIELMIGARLRIGEVAALTIMVLKKYGLAIGKVTPHSLRHTHMTQLIHKPNLEFSPARNLMEQKVTP